MGRPMTDNPKGATPAEPTPAMLEAFQRGFQRQLAVRHHSRFKSETKMSAEEAGLREMLKAAPAGWFATPAAAAEMPKPTNERTATDYALEFAEYLAKDAERLLEAMNAEDALRLRREESDDVSDDDMHDAAADRAEQIRAVRNGIYEFRKRRDRAAKARAAEMAQPAAPEPLTGPLPGACLLPPLPQPVDQERVYGGHGNEIVHQYFSAGQMREYARQSIYLTDEALALRVKELEAALATQAQPATHAEVMTDERIDALMPIGEAEVLWFDPALRFGPEPAGKIIDASIAFMAGARLGTKLFSREQVHAVVRAALATQAAQQPKDLGVSPSGPRSPSQAPPIADAACHRPSYGDLPDDYEVN